MKFLELKSLSYSCLKNAEKHILRIDILFKFTQFRTYLNYEFWFDKSICQFQCIMENRVTIFHKVQYIDQECAKFYSLYLSWYRNWTSIRVKKSSFLVRVVKFKAKFKIFEHKNLVLFGVKLNLFRGQKVINFHDQNINEWLQTFLLLIYMWTL